MVETNAGAGIGSTDDDYRKAGATILDSRRPSRTYAPNQRAYSGKYARQPYPSKSELAKRVMPSWLMPTDYGWVIADCMSPPASHHVLDAAQAQNRAA